MKLSRRSVLIGTLASAGAVVGAYAAFKSPRWGEPAVAEPPLPESDPPDEKDWIRSARFFGAAPNGRGDHRSSPMGYGAPAYHAATDTMVIAHAQGRIDFWNAAEGRHLHNFDNDAPIGNAASFHPDGLDLAFTVAGGVDIWNVKDRRRTTRLRADTPKNDGRGPHILEYSPDGRFLLATLWTGRAHLWEVATGRLIWKSEPGLRAVAIQANGDLATSMDGGFQNQLVIERRSSTGEMVGHIKGSQRLTEPRMPPPPSGIGSCSIKVTIYTGLAFSANGKWLAAARSDGHTDLFETSSGRCMRRFLHSEKAVFSACGRKLLCRWPGSGRLHFFELESGDFKASFGAGEWYPSYGMGFLSGGRQIWASEINDKIFVWDVPG